MDEEEGESVKLSNNNDVASNVVVCGSEVTDLPEGFQLTDSQKECVEIVKRDMERGQMLVFVHGPLGEKLQLQDYSCQRGIYILRFQVLWEKLHLCLKRKRATLCCTWEGMWRTSKRAKSVFRPR